jgi:SAM-dependent methyltransferase
VFYLLMTSEYVLGTHDEELQRLGLQHRVWRDRALDAWRRAGFGAGQTILDVGCGPGFATADLAGIAGRVIAIDQSKRFLEALIRERGKSNIDTFQLDLNTEPLPVKNADGAWVRWVFAFVRDPRSLLERIRAALKPGGTIVIHEYFDYSTWRFSERSAIFENFVATVMRSWRASGGEPDIARDLVTWLGDDVVSTKPIIEVITPSDFMWQWPKTFVNVGLDRLVELGEMTESDAAVVRQEFARLEAVRGIRMFTPAVLEIICN